MVLLPAGDAGFVEQVALQGRHQLALDAPGAWIEVGGGRVVDKAEHGVPHTGAEAFHEKHGLLGLYPGIDGGRALDRGGLHPFEGLAGIVALGRHHADAVLAGGQVFDQGFTEFQVVGVVADVDIVLAQGGQCPGPHLIDNGRTVRIERRIAEDIGLIGSSQGIAEAIHGQLAAGKIVEIDAGAAQAVFAFILGVADGVVVDEGQQENLGRGDGVR